MLLSQGRHSVFHCCFVYFLPDPLKFHIPALLLGRKTRENDERDSDPAQTPAQAATGVWPGDGEGSSVLSSDLDFRSSCLVVFLHRDCCFPRSIYYRLNEL